MKSRSSSLTLCFPSSCFTHVSEFCFGIFFPHRDSEYPWMIPWINSYFCGSVSSTLRDKQIKNKNKNILQSLNDQDVFYCLEWAGQATHQSGSTNNGLVILRAIWFVVLRTSPDSQGTRRIHPRKKWSCWKVFNPEIHLIKFTCSPVRI